MQVQEGIRYLLWAIGLFALQILVLNNMHLNPYTFPFVYPLVLFALPRQTNKLTLIIVGFVLGMVFDVFNNTSGIHAFATTLIAFLRAYALEPLAPSDSASENLSPNVHTMGFQKFALYALLLNGLHHLLVFGLEYFSWSDIGVIFFSMILSVLASTFAMVILQYIFIKKPR